MYEGLAMNKAINYNLYYFYVMLKGLLETYIEAYGKLGKFTPSEEATIRKGGYYTSLMQPNFRILNINSNFG